MPRSRTLIPAEPPAWPRARICRECGKPTRADDVHTCSPQRPASAQYVHVEGTPANPPTTLTTASTFASDPRSFSEQLEDMAPRGHVPTCETCRAELDSWRPYCDACEPPPPTLAAVEAARIRRVLAYTNGHQRQAVALLGIDRNTLSRRMARWGITP
jgi:predicted amidophosphoribosyltransferase